MAGEARCLIFCEILSPIMPPYVGGGVQYLICSLVYSGSFECLNLELSNPMHW